MPFLLETDIANAIVQQGASTAMSSKAFLEKEIAKWMVSTKRKEMLTGSEYYEGYQDILDRLRTVIGSDGLPVAVDNLPNNKVVDNQYSKMVDQKVNYLLSKPITIKTDNDNYTKLLKSIFGKSFFRTLRRVGENSLNAGVSWLHPFYNDASELQFKRFDAHEIIPFWADSDHTVLDGAVRIYAVDVYEGVNETIVYKVEIYDTEGIHRFVWDGATLIPDVENPSTTHMTRANADGTVEGFNWAKVPLIGFKYNAREIPLIRRAKSLQDGINTILSDFENNMQEDARNTILVLQNYDGENLGEFRRNLATYGAVKVKTVDGAAGDLKTLTVEVNAENYKSILSVFKKALVDNCKGYDASELRSGGTPNEMNIKSVFSDIDLDANAMETEYQAAMEELLWFVNAHLNNTGKGDFEAVEVEFVFDRDMVVNESQVITDIKNSVGILSEETLITQHPYVDDVEKELELVKKEKQEAVDQYGAMPGANNTANAGGGWVNVK